MWEPQVNKAADPFNYHPSSPTPFKKKQTKTGCNHWAVKVARLDFFGGYLPSLSINYVAMSKDMERKSPQLYYVKMKISFDLGFIAIGVAMAT